MSTFQQFVILSVLLVQVAFAGGTAKRTCVKQVKYKVDTYIFWIFPHKSITKTRRGLFCCAGYVSVFSKDHQHIEVNSDANCKPFCQPSCPEHSTCQPPRTCECLSSSQDFARPMASKRRCECNAHFVRTKTDTCIRVCPDHCVNGMCIGHKCTCNKGYTKNDLQMCIPHCPDGCGKDRECTNPGMCAPKACKDPGFERDEMGVCLPKCTNGCENGNCTAPEECTCNHGYAMNEGTKVCEAKCDNCTNGVCELPEKCVCDASFEDVDGVCVDTEMVDYDQMSMGTAGTDSVWLFVGIFLGLVVVATVAAVGCYVRKRTARDAGKTAIEAPPTILLQLPRPMLQLPEAAEEEEEEEGGEEEEEIDEENDLYGVF